MQCAGRFYEEANRFYELSCEASRLHQVAVRESDVDASRNIKEKIARLRQCETGEIVKIRDQLVTSLLRRVGDSVEFDESAFAKVCGPNLMSPRGILVEGETGCGKSTHASTMVPILLAKMADEHRRALERGDMCHETQHASCRLTALSENLHTLSRAMFTQQHTFRAFRSTQRNSGLNDPCTAGLDAVGPFTDTSGRPIFALDMEGSQDATKDSRECEKILAIASLLSGNFLVSCTKSEGTHYYQHMQRLYALFRKCLQDNTRSGPRGTLCIYKITSSDTITEEDIGQCEAGNVCQEVRDLHGSLCGNFQDVMRTNAFPLNEVSTERFSEVAYKKHLGVVEGIADRMLRPESDALPLPVTQAMIQKVSAFSGGALGIADEETTDMFGKILGQQGRVLLEKAAADLARSVRVTNLPATSESQSILLASLRALDTGGVETAVREMTESVGEGYAEVAGVALGMLQRHAHGLVSSWLDSAVSLLCELIDSGDTRNLFSYVQFTLIPSCTYDGGALGTLMQSRLSQHVDCAMESLLRSEWQAVLRQSCAAHEALTRALLEKVEKETELRQLNQSGLDVLSPPGGLNLSSLVFLTVDEVDSIGKAAWEEARAAHDGGSRLGETPDQKMRRTVSELSASLGVEEFRFDDDVLLELKTTYQAKVRDLMSRIIQVECNKERPCRYASATALVNWIMLSDRVAQASWLYEGARDCAGGLLVNQYAALMEHGQGLFILLCHAVDALNTRTQNLRTREKAVRQHELQWEEREEHERECGRKRRELENDQLPSKIFNPGDSGSDAATRKLKLRKLVE